MDLGSTQRGISVVSQSYINVIGAGLAGSEAAYQIAERGTSQHLNTKQIILLSWFVPILFVEML